MERIRFILLNLIICCILFGCDDDNQDEKTQQDTSSADDTDTGDTGDVVDTSDTGTMSLNDASPPDDAVSRFGEYSGYSEKIYDGFELTSQYVEVRDGTKLALDLYRPKDKDGNVVETPLPVVWMHMPYGRSVPGGGFLLATMAETYPGTAASLIDYGYVVAVVDFRGLYASFGQNAGYNRGEWVEAARMDAYDITEWLAKQPWSTGKIGMWGCSATGGSQMQATTTAPPSLKAVFPMSCEFDAYPFGVAGGVAPEQGDTRSPPSTIGMEQRNLLAVPVDGDTNRELLNAAIADHGEDLDNLGYMPFRDSVAEQVGMKWWMESSPHTYLDQINASNTAFYLAANWDEAATKYGVFFSFNNITRPARMLLGPSGHCNWNGAIGVTGGAGKEGNIGVIEETGFDITVEELRFFDYWLKDIDNGIMDQPKVVYYIYGAPKGEEWGESDAWPLTNERRVDYYFGPGLLSTEVPTEDKVQDDFVVSYELDENGDAIHGLVYETPELEKAVQVIGHPVVDMWLSSTATDSDVVAYLQNVAPDGSVTSYSMHGRLRASLRKEETAPYNNLGLPWHPFREADAQPLVPGEVVELRFDVLPTAMIFGVGHKIRLFVTFASSATPQINPAPTVSIYRDATHQSKITLPIIEQ
jgi:hypothetical protein